MFRLQNKQYWWEGNFWNPIADGYEYVDMYDREYKEIQKPFDNLDEAIREAKERADNPYVENIRVINEITKEVMFIAKDN